MLIAEFEETDPFVSLESDDSENLSKDHTQEESQNPYKNYEEAVSEGNNRSGEIGYLTWYISHIKSN